MWSFTFCLLLVPFSVAFFLFLKLIRSSISLNHFTQPLQSTSTQHISQFMFGKCRNYSNLLKHLEVTFKKVSSFFELAMFDFYLLSVINWNKRAVGQQQFPPSKTLYDKTNQLVEKVNSLIYFALMKVVVPCFIWPILIPSMYAYFFSNSDDALQLPVPVW